VSVEDSLCTLQEAFEKVDLFIGLNIELKFDDEIQYTEDQLRHILQVILEVRNESFHNLIEHRNRRQTVDGKYL
jgi:glycerophosphodiester phosphodiesterase